MSKEEQLELDLNDEDKNTTIVVENLTLTSDRVLAQAIGKFEHVFVIGVEKDGASYFSDHSDVAYWCFLLDRAKQFIMRNSY